MGDTTRSSTTSRGNYITRPRRRGTLTIGNFNTKRQIERRKAKTKTCLIDECVAHQSASQKSIKEVHLHEFVDDFLNVCETELETHDDYGTWKLTPCTGDMNVVGSTCSFDINGDMNHKILRFKARLCAQGFTQPCYQGNVYMHVLYHVYPISITIDS